MLNPATRLDPLVCLAIQRWPVLDRARQAAYVDDVEVVVGKYPVIFDVVDEETAIGRRPPRLDRAEIYACHLGMRMCGCVVDAPDTSSASHVQYFPVHLARAALGAG